MIHMNFKPKDVIAVLVIISWLICKLNGIDGTADGALGIMIGYYFAKRTEGKDNGY